MSVQTSQKTAVSIPHVSAVGTAGYTTNAIATNIFVIQSVNLNQTRVISPGFCALPNPASGLYVFNSGPEATLSSAGTAMPPYVWYHRSSDYPALLDKSPRFSLQMVYMVPSNGALGDVTATIGLYSVTSGGGGNGVKKYNYSIVPASATTTITSDVGDPGSFTSISQVLTFPSDGWYGIAANVTGTWGANTRLHISANMVVSFG